MKRLWPLALLLAAAAAAGVLLFGGGHDEVEPARTRSEPGATAPSSGPAVRSTTSARPKIVVPPAEVTADEPGEAPLEEESGDQGTGVEGVVVAPDGAPVSGAVVSVLRESRQTGALHPTRRRVHRGARTDARGHFRVTGLAGGGGYVVRAEHGAYAAVERAGLTIEKGSVLPLGSLKLRQGVRIVGVVSGPDGRGVDAARVTAYVLDRGRPRPVRQVLTGEDGSYRLEHLPPGPVEVEVEAEGRSRVRTEPMFLRENRPEVRRNFRLESGLSIVGSIRTPDRQPIPGARIEASLLRGHVRSHAEVLSDERGRFELSGLVAGPYRVVVRRNGFARAEKSCTLPETKRLTFVLQPTVGVTGKVLDGNGKPVPAFFLQVFRATADGHLAGALAPPFKVRSADGSFEVPDLEPGRYRLKAFAPGWAPTLGGLIELHRTWVRGARVRLQPGGALVGRVVDASGAPLADATVRLLRGGYAEMPLGDLLYDPSTRVARQRTGPDGAFRFEALEPGRYQVRVESPDYRAGVVDDIPVKRKETHDVGEIRMSRGARVEGTVLGPSAVPLAGARVTLTHLESHETVELVTDPRGRFAAEHLAPGEWQVACVAPPRPQTSGLFAPLVQSLRTSRRVTLVDGQSLPLTLTVAE